MRRSGASKAASTSFLIATPQTGVDSIAATWSLLGPAFAVVRPVAALVTSLFGGLAVGKAEENPTEEHVHCVAEEQTERRSFGRKCIDALRYGYLDLVGSIGGWLVFGLIVAAVITVYVPSDFFSILGDWPLFSMIAVLIIAIPMYVCATGSIPIALSLMMKGLSPGTALVLLMAGPAANFASFALISREMGRKTAIIYLSAIIAGAMAFGLAIDYLLPSGWFDVNALHAHACHQAHLNMFSTVCSAILVALLIVALIRGHRHNHVEISDLSKEYTIKGMNCSHCQAAVEETISSVSGVEKVVVNLTTGIARVEGTHDSDDVVSAVRKAGFDVEI